MEAGAVSHHDSNSHSLGGLAKGKLPYHKGCAAGAGGSTTNKIKPTESRVEHTVPSLRGRAAAE